MKKVVLGLGVVFSITACSESLPTEELAKENIEAVIKLQSKDKIELNDFRKTDGVREKINEVDNYVLAFEGKITYTETGWTLEDDYHTKKGFLLLVNEKPSGWGSYEYVKVEKGTSKDIKGAIRFIKTENGWTKDRVRMTLINN